MPYVGKKRLGSKEDRISECYSYDAESGSVTRKDGAQKHGNTKPDPCAVNKGGYAIVRFERGAVLVHRLAWLLMTGDWPKNEIDHINGIRLDNRWSNLRQCSNEENARNCKLYKNNKTGFKGVRKTKTGRFSARIGARGSISLGTFDTPEQASEAYVKAALSLHGNFHRPSSVSSQASC